MKKIFYLASIAALAFSSCAKDETTEAQIGAVNGGAKITAAMAADETRTSLEKVDGKYEFRWSAGDQLGVYGVGGGLNNAAFVLNNDSDGKAVGVFASQSTELKADKAYVAVYPRFQTSLFSAADIAAVKWDNPAKPTPSDTTDDISYPNYENVKVTIPAVQKYQPETFYTQTVPAVSTTFVVDENSAQVSMQPVVDYLFVNIESTEPISKLTLKLLDGANGNADINIAGQGKLEKYILNGEYRYMLNEITENASTSITLEMDEASNAVTCHNANTYVFAVPAGILGMGEAAKIKAQIFVNDDTAAAFTLTDATGTGLYPNAQLNYYTTGSGANLKKIDRYDNANSKFVSRLENTVFWANTLKDGVRTSFTYNPNGDVIIENEVELLEYIHKYNADVAGFAGEDAFLCEDGSFDFSIKNMMELATEYANTKYEPYIAAYLADDGVFPCFNNYTNNFIGNGAVIENIEQPLGNPAGIFGGPWYGDEEYKNWELVDVDTRGGEFVETENGGKSITNVTFANIVAATVEFDYDYANGIFGEYEFQFSGRGYILAGAFDGTIKNVVVKDADAEAIMGDMTVAQFNGLTIEGVSKLANIADYLVVNDKLDMTKTWNSVKGVQESVFQFIDPHRNAKNESAIYEIIIPEGDASTYAKLTDLVKTESSSAVAVLIDGVSYWTGDEFAPSKDVKKADGTVIGKYVRYAEELAAASGDIELTRNMDLNFNNLYIVEYVKGYPYPVDGAYCTWDKVTLSSLNGAGYSVSNVVMYAEDEDQDGKLDNIAPFAVPVVKDFTLNNVYINVATDADEVEATVPEVVAGMTLGGVNAKGQTVITNATVNGLIIDTAREDNTNNTEANYGSYVSYIGWMVGAAADAQITNAKVNGIQSAVKGIAGLVAKNSVNTSSKFEKVSVANVDAVNTALANFTQWNPAKNNYNVMGTAVGLVGNNANRKADIKFVDCGAPVFLYYAPSSLTVIYDNVEKGSLKNK